MLILIATNGQSQGTELRVLTPEASKKEKVTRGLEGWGGGGGRINRPSSTFDTIHLIYIKFGTYNKLHFYFQLSETTCCLIGFHCNNCQMTLQAAAILDFKIFRFCSIFHFCTSN